MIIGLVGKKRSGKDTVADHLVRRHDFIKYSLADPMKKAVQEIFLLSDEQLWGDRKESLDARYNTTARKILQVFGTELFQYDIYKHIPEMKKKVPPRKLWINRFKLWYRWKQNSTPIHSLNALNEFTVGAELDIDVVISDVRFPHEVEEIKKLDGIIIRIYNELCKDLDKHPSETEMNDIKHDFMLFNNNAIKDLYKSIDKLIGDIRWKSLFIDS